MKKVHCSYTCKNTHNSVVAVKFVDDPKLVVRGNILDGIIKIKKFT